jgi:hypothetical protein
MPPPAKNTAESFGEYAARELIAAKAAGKVLTAVPLANFIDVLFHDWQQRTPSVAVLIAEPGAITAEAIYQAYPRKEGKKAALKAIANALKPHDGVKVSAAFLLKMTTTYAAAVAQWSPAKRYTRDGTDTVPHPTTWFNQGRYLDDPTNWQAKAARTASATDKPRDYRII